MILSPLPQALFEPDETPNLIEHMDLMARLHPEQVMLHREGQNLSWSAFRQHVRALAEWMRREGQMRPGDRVGLHHDDDFAHLVVLYACWLVQLIPVNLGLALDAQTLSDRLQESGCRMLVIDHDHLGQCQTALLQSPVRKVVVTHRDDTVSVWQWLANRLNPGFWWGELRRGNTLFEPYDLRDVLQDQGEGRFDPVDPQQIALIHYTNGLSSEPRAVSYNYQVLMSAVHRASILYQKWLAPNQRHVCLVPLSMSLALGYGLLVLYRGGTLSLCRPEQVWRHPERCLRGAVSMVGYPALYRRFLEANIPAQLLAPMQLFFCGGGHVPWPLQQEWQAHTGQYIHAMYGLSEAGFLVAANTPDQVDPHSDGRLVAGMNHRICHPLTHESSDSDTGELFLQSQLMMDSYWQNRGAMESCMSRDGWLRTGDLVQIRDQWITVVCRCSDLLWRQDRMILPQTLEQLTNRQPHVRASAAIQEVHGVHRRIVLLVEADEGLDIDALTLTLMDQLPESDLPDQVRRVDRLPRSLQNEVSRRMARELFLSGESGSSSR